MSRILVADDEPQITRILRTSLKTHNYDVRAADDGVGALALFREWHPDLVVTDLVMPRMNGLELCQAIRASSLTPIIILSARGEERMKVEALDAGADDYVTKPFGMNELLARVRAAFRRAPPAAVSDENAILETGDFRVDGDARRVEVRGHEVQGQRREASQNFFLCFYESTQQTSRRLCGLHPGARIARRGECVAAENTPMCDDEGQLLGAVTLLEDITHLREVDQLKSEFISRARLDVFLYTTKRMRCQALKVIPKPQNAYKTRSKKVV